jgi:hypothetical protein
MTEFRELLLPPPGLPVSKYLPDIEAVKRLEGNAPLAVQVSNTAVIIGANGAGKTRLGAWIELEGPQQIEARRISAQKSLSMPTEVRTRSVDAERAALLHAYKADDYTPRAYPQRKTWRLTLRWHKNPITHLLDDYKDLVALLLSENADAGIRYMEASAGEGARLPQPETLLGRVREIWEAVFPHRRLRPRAGKIEVAGPAGDEATYNASELSDGERVGFYLIGQCMAADLGSLIVIDEPELHLHRAVQGPLWDAIEAARPDCLFVYITHDLDFAASRLGATKIWVKSFDGEVWDWSVVPESEIPEHVLFTVLGSRRDILFTEGTQESLEDGIYKRIYDGWTVIPRGSCRDVIHDTVALSSLPHLHGLRCRGIVDRDYRTDQQVADLMERGIATLDHHHIEALLLDSGVILAAARLLSSSSILTEPAETTVEKVEAAVFDDLSKNRDSVATAVAAWRVKAALKTFRVGGVGELALRDSLSSTLIPIDPTELYSRAVHEVDAAIAQRDYRRALHLTHNKGLTKEISRILCLPPSSYPRWVQRVIATPEGEKVLAALREAAPAIA